MMERKLKSPTKNLSTSKSKEVQSKNASPNGNIATKYQLRNLYVSLQRLPPSDVDKWKHCDQFSKTSMEINISPDSKNDNKTMVKNRKSINSTTKKLFDENKIENIDDSSGTADSKNTLDSSIKQLSQITEQGDGKSLSISRRSSLRNASTNLVTKNVSPSTSNNVKNEPLKDDPNVNISFSSDQNLNESKNLLEANLSPTRVNRSKIEEHKVSVSVTSSNNTLPKNKSKETENHGTQSNLENVVRHLRSKTINRNDESSLQLQKKLKTSINENISTSETSNKLKRGLDEDENGSEHKVMLKKVKRISESEDSLEKIGSLCNTPESSNPNNITELKSSLKKKTTLTKNITGTTSDNLNKSNNDLQKDKKKNSKEFDLSEEEPRLLRSSTVKQTQSYDSKIEDIKSPNDNPKSPPIFDQNRYTTKTNVEQKDKLTSINDEKKKSKQSSDGDLIEPRVLRSSTVKQVPSPSKGKLEIEDKNKNSDISFDDSPESPPLTEQLSSPTKTKIVLLKEINSKKLPKSNIIRDPRKINKIIENPTIEKDSKNSSSISKEIEQPSPSSNLNQISNTSNLENTDLEENSKVKKSSLSKIDSKTAIVSKSENEILPHKKEIPLFEPTLASKNIRTYSRKGKRKYKINNQYEINDSSKVVNEIIIDAAETSLENNQIDKSSISIVNPVGQSNLDEIKDKSNVADDSCSSVQEVIVPMVLMKEQEKGIVINTPLSQDKPPDGVEENIKTLETKKTDSIPKGSLKLANIKNKYVGSDKSCKKSKDLTTLMQISKMEEFISEIFHSSSFKNVSKNVDDSHKKSTSSEYSPLLSISKTTKIIAEGDSSSKSNDTTETTPLARPKKLRKNSSNNPCDDKKSMSALSPNITTKRKISISEKNESHDAEKGTNNVAEATNKLNTSANIASQSKSPIVEISSIKEASTTNEVSKLSSPTGKNLTKPKGLKKKKNSLPSNKLSHSSKLINIDNNSVKDKITANISNEISTSQPIQSASKDDVDSNRSQLLKTNQGTLENETIASTSNKISEIPTVPEANNDLIEKIDSKESLAAKKLSTSKHPSKGASKQESPSNKSNECLELLPQATDNSKKNFSVPVKKLSIPKQLSKRVINKKIPSKKSNELLKLQPQTTGSDSIKLKEDIEKDVTVLANQLPPSRQILKRAVKKETPSNASREILKSSPAQTTSNDGIIENVGLKKDTPSPSKTLPERRLSKSDETVGKEDTPSNIASEIFKSSLPQTTSNDVIIENVGLKKDTPSPSKTLPKRRLSKSDETLRKEDTPSSIASEIFKSPPPQTTSNDVTMENVGLKKDNRSPSKTLPKRRLSKSDETVGKKETPSSIAGEISKSPPTQTTSNDELKESVGLKKNSTSSSKTLPKRQLSKTNESVVTVETCSNMAHQVSKSPSSQTISHDIVKENVGLKKDRPLPSKTLPKRQVSKSNESVLKTETPTNSASQISKSDDMIKESVDLKKVSPLPSKTLPKRQVTKSNERVVIAETPTNSASQISKSDDIIKESVGLKKDSSLPSKTLPKRQVTKSNERVVIAETPTNSASQISKSDEKIKENVGLTKDSPLPSKTLPKRQVSKSNENVVVAETPTNSSSQISKSDDITKEYVGLKKDTSSPTKTLSKKQLSKSNESVVKVGTPSNMANEDSKQPPAQTTGNDITKENVGLKKGTSSPSKTLPKKQLSKSNESVVRAETTTNNASQISKSDNITKENVGLKKGYSSPSKTLPKKRLSKSNESVLKVEASSNVTSQISKQPPSQTTRDDITKENVGLKKGTSSPSKTLTKKRLSKSSESVLKVEDSSNMANQVSKQPPTETTCDDITKENVSLKEGTPSSSKTLPKKQLSKSNESVVKVETSSNMARQISKSPPTQTASDDIIKENLSLKKGKSSPPKTLPKKKLSKSNKSVVKVETSTNISSEISKSSPARAARKGLIKRKVRSKKDTSAPSINLEEVVREIIVIDEPLSNTSNEISKFPSTNDASKGLTGENITSKKDTRLPSEKVSYSEVVVMDKPSSNTSNESSTLLPIQAASSDFKKEIIDSKDDPTLSSEREPNMEIAILEEPSSNTSNKISTLQPTETTSSDLNKNNIDSKEDSSLTSEKVPPTMENVIEKEPTSSTSDKISTLPPTEAVRSDVKKEEIALMEDSSLLAEKVTFMEIVLIEEPSSNTSNEIPALPPTDTASSDLKKEKNDSKENPSLPSEKVPPVEIVVLVEEPSSNTSDEISTMPPNEAACSDLRKEKIDSKEDSSLTCDNASSTVIVIIEEPSSNSSNEISTLPSTEAASSDLKKEKIDSKEDSSLTCYNASSTVIVIIEEPLSNSSNEMSTTREIVIVEEPPSNEISILPPTETASSDLKKDPSLPPEKVPPTEIVTVEEPPSNTSYEISKTQSPQDVIKKNINHMKDASLPSQKLLFPNRLTESNKSSINEKTSIDSTIKISKSLSTQVPSSDLKNVKHTSSILPNMQSNSDKIPSKQAASDDLIRSQIYLKKNTSLSTAELSSLSQVSKTIKKDESVKALNKIPKLPSPQMSRYELMKHIVTMTRDVSLPSRNLSHSQLSRMYRAALFQQISKYKFGRSVYTQTDNDFMILGALSNSQLLEKKRKFNQGRSSLPLSTNLLSTNHSLNVNYNILQKTNFQNSSLVSRPSNGQPLEKKRKFNQGRSSLPLSRNQTTQTIKDQYANHTLKVKCNTLQKTNFQNSSLVSRPSNGQPLEKKRKLNQDRSNLPLSRNQTTQTIKDQYTNHSLKVNCNMIKKTNFPNSSLVMRTSNGQLLQRKRKIDQPYSNQIPKKIRKEENSIKPSSVIGINEGKKTNMVAMKNIKSPRVVHGTVTKGESSSKSPVEVCSSCRRCTYTPPSSISSKHLIKEFYSSQKESLSSTNQTNQTCCMKDNSSKIINKIIQKSNPPSKINNSNKISNKQTNSELLSMPKQSIIDSLKNVRKNQPTMIIELVSPTFYRNILETSNYTSLQLNRTVNQAEHLSLNSSIIRTEQIDHVFKVPTKAPPRAKNKKMTKSETFLVPKANELEIGILVRTCLGLAIKSGRTIIIPRELPEGIRFNLAYGLDKIYFRRKYIYDPNNSENIKESKEINDLQFDNDYLSFKNKYEKPVLIGDKIDSDQEKNSDENNIKLSNRSSLNFDNLKNKDFLKLRKARIELIRMYNKKGHISPLTNDKIMSHLISHQCSKSDKNGKLKTNNAEKFVTIKKSISFDSNPTAEEILKISGHDGYCTKLSPPPYYELMKRGIPFSPKHYFIAMQRKKNSLNPDYSTIDLNNINDNQIKLPDNKFENQNSSDNFNNEEKFKYNLRTGTKSKFNSERCNTALKESIDNSLSPKDDSESDENETVSDENSAEDTVKKSSETNNLESIFQLDEYVSELKRLDQSIINAAKNYKTSINVEQVNKDLRLIVPKDGYRNELPERPTEWFLKFVTKFRKLELWRLHNLFKVHDNLRRIESAKINVLEKMYEKLSGNSLNDESEK